MYTTPEQEAVINALKAKQRNNPDDLTVIEKLILACGDPRTQIDAAMELHSLNGG